MHLATAGYPMNPDHVEGRSKDVKGSVNDTAGRVTGVDRMRAEGKVQGAHDAAKDKMSKK